MSSTRQQLNAYTNTQKSGESSLRDIEARALLNCASKLREAQEQQNDFNLYLDAIKTNQRLWTIFQVSLCEPENPLPRDLKITLLNLSRFIDKISLRAQAEYNPGLLDSMIDINRNIAAGLNTRPEGESALPPPTTATAAAVMTSA